MKKSLEFRKFIENSSTQDYFSAVGEELGINSEDLFSALEKQPWLTAHFPLGKLNKEVLYKMASWEIVPGTLTPNGADIRLKPTSNTRSYLKGNQLNKSPNSDEQRYHLNRDQLIKFMTTGWTPASSNPGSPGGAPISSLSGGGIV